MTQMNECLSVGWKHSLKCSVNSFSTLFTVGLDFIQIFCHKLKTTKEKKLKNG